MALIFAFQLKVQSRPGDFKEDSSKSEPEAYASSLPIDVSRFSGVLTCIDFSPVRM